MNFMNKAPIRDIFVPVIRQDKVNRLPMLLPVNTTIILCLLSTPLGGNNTGFCKKYEDILK